MTLHMRASTSSVSGDGGRGWIEHNPAPAMSDIGDSLFRDGTDIGDSLFHKGQDVWVIQPDGTQRAAEYVGQGELNAWFGGPPTVIVVYPDTREGAAVEVDRVIARE
jgi:hypothetical protein